MSAGARTDLELWNVLQDLDDDLLDAELPEALVDDYLRSLGADPDALAERSVGFMASIKEDERLAWQQRAQRRRDELAALAAATEPAVPQEMNRTALLARLAELRDEKSGIGNAIKMAARKRRPEESTDDELRALLSEMEVLRALEDSESGG